MLSTSLRRAPAVPGLIVLTLLVGLVMALALPGSAATADVPAPPPEFGAPRETVPPVPTPVTDHCPHRVHTPPAIDESEVVAPGHPTPQPLPVPSPAVGGDRLGECGIVTGPNAEPVPRALTSAGWLIADLDTGAIIAAKDPHGRYRPASTIKTLLALTVLDELDLNMQVRGTAEDYMVEGDSCGIGPDGIYTVRDLLSGLLLVSGNDCANALARTLGGHAESLAKMNQRAAELGAHDTRAASPSGLDAAGMSTSPYDLALIFREAMRHPDFRHIIGLKTYEFPGFPPLAGIPGDGPHPGYTMSTSNSLLREGYPGILGGKTGYTDDALKTFVAGVERDGRRLVIVQLAGLNVAGDSYVQQAQRMIDYGFAAPSSGAGVGTLATAPAQYRSPYAPAPTAEQASAADADSPSATGLAVTLCALIAIVIAGFATLLIQRKRAKSDSAD